MLTPHPPQVVPLLPQEKAERLSPTKVIKSITSIAEKNKKAK